VSDVVVDESVWIRALFSECTLAESDLTCASLMGNVQVSHRWVMTFEIADCYWHQLAKVNCDGITRAQLIRSLQAILHDSERLVWLDSVERVTGQFDTRDEHIVSAAAAVPGSVLLTLDGDLIGELLAAAIPSTRGFNVMHPETAKL
jgi:hypothetical protein